MKFKQIGLWVAIAILVLFGMLALLGDARWRLFYLRLIGMGLGSMGVAYFYLRSGQLCMGAGGFVALGAYVAAWVLQAGSAPWRMLPGFVCAVLLPTLLGGLVGSLLLRLRGDALSLATLGFGEIIRIFLEHFEPLGGAAGLFGLPHWSSPWQMALLTAGVLIWLTALQRGKGGLKGRAVSADPLAAAACGVSVYVLQLRAFCIMAAVCGASGFLLGGTVGFLHPTDFGYLRSCDLLASVVLGGGSLLGSLLAGVLLETITLSFAGFGIYKMLIYGLVLMLLPLIKQTWKGKRCLPNAKIAVGRRASHQKIRGAGGRESSGYSTVSRRNVRPDRF